MTNLIDLDTLEDAKPMTQRIGVAFDDEGNPTVGFIIVSKDSFQYVQASHKMRSMAIRRQSNKGQKIDTKTEVGAETLDKLLQDNDLELAVAVTIDWFGFTKGGVPAPCTEAAIRNAYKLRPTWREKVSAALEAEAGFLPT